MPNEDQSRGVPKVEKSCIKNKTMILGFNDYVWSACREEGVADNAGPSAWTTVVTATFRYPDEMSSVPTPQQFCWSLHATIGKCIDFEVQRCHLPFAVCDFSEQKK